MTLDNMVSALQELKSWRGLPYCIEEPMGIEGLGVVTDDLIDNLITLTEFVESPRLIWNSVKRRFTLSLMTATCLTERLTKDSTELLVMSKIL